MPREAGGVFDGFLKLGRGLAIGNHIKPVAIASVFGNAALVRGEEESARWQSALQPGELRPADAQVLDGTFLGARAAPRGAPRLAQAGPRHLEPFSVPRYPPFLVLGSPIRRLWSRGSIYPLEINFLYFLFF